MFFPSLALCSMSASTFTLSALASEGPKTKTASAEDRPAMHIRRQADPTGQITDKPTGRKTRVSQPCLRYCCPGVQ
jgi:hypothetical protein